MQILVLGLGNILLQDEGIGVHAVQELARRYDLPEGVQVVDGGTAAMDLLETMARKDLVILIDAVRSGQPPGSVIRLAHKDLPIFFRTRISPHQLGIAEVLATLQVLGDSPTSIVLLGMEPRCMDIGLELTAEVRLGLDELLRRVIKEMQDLGVHARPRAPAASLADTYGKDVIAEAMAIANHPR